MAVYMDIRQWVEIVQVVGTTVSVKSALVPLAIGSVREPFFDQRPFHHF